MQTGSPLFDVAQVHAIDRAASERLGIAGFELMARAGAAALALLRRRWPGARRVLVACGHGNNGGDGYVLARLAREAGLEATVVVAEAGTPRTQEARRAEAAWTACGGRTRVFDGTLEAADVLVDALLGIGLAEAPREPLAGLIRAVDAHPAPVLALDVPSGIDADRGHAPGAVVHAAATLVFIAGKRGLHTGAARDCTGTVEFAALAVPPSLLGEFEPVAGLWRAGSLAACLAPRRAGAHKGEHGHVLVVGGDHGMGGAARLAGEAALRTGAGLVSVATRGEHVAPLLAARPELMVRAVQSPADLDAALVRCDVLAVGPGLGQGDWGRALFAHCLVADRPLVLDADALNLLAGRPVVPEDAVLTPHPGEAARLLGCTTAQVQQDRFAAAAALVDRFHAVVVLKGAGTLVAAPGRTPVVIDAGNPGMASGGTGDVLTGVIAALRAQGLTAFEAACCGALLHGAAGDHAAREGERGLLATDLMPALRRLANPDAR